MRSVVPLVLLAFATAAPRPAPAQAPSDTGGGTLGGVVYDSIARRPLAGALVQVVSLRPDRRTHAAHTDSVGAFRVTSLEPGRYLIGFHHPVLDSLLVEMPGRTVDVALDDPARADLAIPAASTIVRTVCGDAAPADSAGLLVGQLLAAASGEAVRDGAIIAEWTQLVVDAGGARRETPEVRGRSDASGRFALCHLPTDTELLVHAARGGDSSGYVPLQVPPRGVLRRDVVLGGARRSTARLTGTVSDETRRPLANARVEVWGSGVEGVTNERGEFALDGLPIGTQTVEARAIGFAPRRSAVDLAEGGSATVTLVLEARAVVLDTMRVRGRRSEFGFNGFERRRATGFGHFFDGEFLKRRRANRTSDIMREVPALWLEQRRGQLSIRRLLEGRRFCVPAAFVDGFALPDGANDIDNFTMPDEIAAIEVYTSRVSMPARFHNECGSIVIWTKEEAVRSAGR